MNWFVPCISNHFDICSGSFLGFENNWRGSLFGDVGWAIICVMNRGVGVAYAKYRYAVEKHGRNLFFGPCFHRSKAAGT
jgi:hypothetical protein